MQYEYVKVKELNNYNNTGSNVNTRNLELINDEKLTRNSIVRSSPESKTAKIKQELNSFTTKIYKQIEKRNYDTKMQTYEQKRINYESRGKRGNIHSIGSSGPDMGGW